MRRWTTITLAIVCLAGCEATDLRDGQLGEDTGDNSGFEGAVGGPYWSWPENPDDFAETLDASLVTEFSRLPLAGDAAQSAWPASTWPALHDGTNHRWLPDELSPMEKYDLAFNGWQTTKSFEELTPYNPSRCEEQDYDALYADSLGPAAQWASRHRGNWIAHDRVDSDGDGLEDECDDLDGMETWWDLDHAWAAAASVEEEPAEPVSVNGVNFWPSDVKALLLTVYDSSTSFILSGTCRASQLERNYKGLPLNKGCEGLDAGDFHVLLTNFVGRFQAAISEEVTENGRIVSRPIDSYSVELQRSIEADEAVALLGQESAGDGTYLLNPDARAWIEVEVSTQALVSSAPSQTGLLADVETFTTSRVHHYVLELDSEDRILGGQWVKDAKSQTSPDFLWIVQGPRFQRVVGDPEPELDAPSNPFVRYSEVLALLNQATGNSGGSDLEIATATP